jgi:DNA-directed RNA polymerase specialized sigma24 family protein
VKGWLSQGIANTVLRGEHGSRIARWSRWLRRTGPVADSNFQGPTDPYPRHWRHFPPPWRRTSTEDAETREHLRRALDGLPLTWRAVVDRHDIAGISDTDVAGELDITYEHERSILTRARAALRDQLAELLGRVGGR